MQDHPLRRWLNHLIKKKGQAVLVKALARRDRRRILRHFLALDRDDRLLRFGSVLPDELIEAYVAKLDFSKDIVFGVVNGRFQLVGVGHLAFTSREAHPDSIHYTDKEKVAEFGVSVSASARGQGVGTRLFERAAIHCRNSDVEPHDDAHREEGRHGDPPRIRRSGRPPAPAAAQPGQRAR